MAAGLSLRELLSVKWEHAVKVGRGDYSRADIAPAVSVVRGPRRTIEVEEGTLPSCSLLYILPFSTALHSFIVAHPPVYRETANSRFRRYILVVTRESQDERELLIKRL